MNVEALLASLQAKLEAWAGERYIVFLAGVPAAGKSTLARQLADADPRIQVLPMDGFHLANAELDRRQIVIDGTAMRLRRVKGCPESFDLAALTDHLQRLRAGERGLRWPRYDRQFHEPVPAAIEVQARGICLVEGNYLLLDEAGWRDLAALAHLTLFLACDEATAHKAILRRHVQGGRSPADAEAHYRFSDARNHRRILAHQIASDIVIDRR